MKIIDISIRRRVTVAMFTLAILLFGAVSFFRLKINLLPELTYPTLTIRTEYRGAAPAEIENLITKPIEEAVGVVKNVQQVRSISRSSQSDVLLEFAWGTNMDYASLDVREKLDALQLPLEVKRPIILRFDPSLDPIMRFGLSKKLPAVNSEDSPKDKPETTSIDQSLEATETVSTEDELKYLRRFADEQIKKELESALGVAAVKVSGGLEDEIQVLTDQARLAQLKLPIEEIARLIGAENINLSGGRLEEGTQQYLVRTLNQFRSIEEINDVVVANKSGALIYLRDVAKVYHGYKERDAITRINGNEGVEIAIYKEGDANTVAVARAVEKRLRQVYKMLPTGLELIKVYDQSTFITQAVKEVVNAAVIGGVLAFLVLYFFLRNIWTTIIISLAIPVSVIATFNLMYGTNLTLNIMSLGGIALGIGLLVDNAIVVLENIAGHREKGKTVLESARDGAGEVSMAVTASTLTSVAVFFPLVFVKGIAGQLFRDQALTVTFALLASLVVALTLIPMLASLESRSQHSEAASRPPNPRTRIGRWIRRSRVFFFTTMPIFILRLIRRGLYLFTQAILFIVSPLLNIFSRGFALIQTQYPILLKWALGHRSTVLAVAFMLFFISLRLIPTLGVELIPQLSQGEFGIEFRLPPGTPLERTDLAIATVQKTALDIKNISTTFSVSGTGNRMDANPEEGGENWGELNVAMRSGLKRADEESAMAALREELAHLPGVQYKFARPTLFSFKTPIEIEVAGFDLEKLKSVSSEIARRMEALPRFADVKSTMEIGHPEIQIHFDQERAATLGLPVYQIAERIVNKIRGDVATRYSWHDRKIDILVRSQEKDRNSIEQIRRLIVNPQSDRPVPLEAVANIVVDTGPGEIRRIGQQRVALVTANLRSGDLGSAAEEIADIIHHVPTPNGLVVRLTGQNEEMAVSFRSLQFALLLAIFLVYLVMASQFESIIHPFVILFTIPLALIGAVFALLITGSTISVVVFIGLILLAGIVVNNAIVLIDLINQLQAKGRKKIEAILEAGKSRLRPIMMTTLTTVLGLLPLAIGFGEGTEVRAPMAITVIGGLLVSTLLTLIVIPVMYAVVDRRE